MSSKSKSNLIKSDPCDSSLEFDHDDYYQRTVCFYNSDFFQIAEKLAISSLYLGSGRHRCVFDYDSDWVIKVPRYHSGCESNTQEYEISKGWRNPESFNGKPIEGIKFPNCELISYKSVPLLLMEKIRPVYTPANFEEADEDELELAPKWIHGLDCCQAGINKQGEWVAYDFSIN